MEGTILVPLRSIMINRGGPVDALEQYERTGKAVQFTPGEVEMLVAENGGSFDLLLREPTASEIPSADGEAAAP